MKVKNRAFLLQNLKDPDLLKQKHTWLPKLLHALSIMNLRYQLSPVYALDTIMGDLIILGSFSLHYVLAIKHSVTLRPLFKVISERTHLCWHYY